MKKPRVQLGVFCFLLRLALVEVAPICAALFEMAHIWVARIWVARIWVAPIWMAPIWMARIWVAPISRSV
jgi:hypothetical protein